MTTDATPEPNIPTDANPDLPKESPDTSGSPPQTEPPVATGEEPTSASLPASEGVSSSTPAPGDMESPPPTEAAIPTEAGSAPETAGGASEQTPETVAEAQATTDASPPAPVPPAVTPQPVPQVPPVPQSHDLSRIAQDLQVRKAQVEAVVQLSDDGNTVPFITRYRKERTGGLNEDAIRRILERVQLLRQLADRKQTILRSIANQGKLTDALVEAILTAEHPKRLEDLYLPYKPKKRTLASDARDKGLEPLALAIWNRDPAVDNLDEVLPGMVDGWKQLHDVNDVITGVRNILAELVAELAEVRGPLRLFLWDTGLLVSHKLDNVPEAKGLEYRDYFDFKEPVRQIPPHRILAVNRGEKEQIIKARMEWDKSRVIDIALSNLDLGQHPHRDMLIAVVADAIDRLVMPSLEREIRRDLTDRAQDRAVHIFAQNLRSLLLQPPLQGARVLAIDPGLRTGCKLAALDETGQVLEDAVIYPHPPQKRIAESKLKLEQLIRKHQTPIIAIGNGTACRETEQLVSDLIAELEDRRLNPKPTVVTEPMVTSEPVAQPAASADAVSETPPEVPSLLGPGETVSSPVLAVTLDDAGPTSLSTVVAPVDDPSVTTPAQSSAEASITAPMEPSPATAAPPPPPAATISLEGLAESPAELAYVIVNEAGASDYSASPIAKDEFPQFDATTRGTISIGRRLQDPLAELVKIDPQHVGVGLYQHDVRPKHLKESLETVIESCVNHVGVELNTASVPLLRHVSGLNQLVARELVEYRKANGPFRSREQLQNVPNFGEKRYTQAAGFLKIAEGEEPLDITWVHPESYPLARQILSDLGFTSKDLLDRVRVAELQEKLKTINVEELAGRLQAGVPTIRDICDALARPGRDPREDLPPPIFKKGILKLEDLQTGMELKGTVLNVVDFGAFVDVGLKDSGLVHISQMANRYIKSPYDVVAVGDVVTVWVINVDSDRRRVSLSMISPGTDRRPPERERRPSGDRHAHGEGQGQRGGGQVQGQGQGRPERPAGQPGGGGRPGSRFVGTQGRGPGAGQRGGQQRGGPRQGAPAGQPRGEGQPSAAPQAPPPPRKPSKPKPLPTLTTDKKAGKAPLNTFAELAALFNTKQPEKPGDQPQAAPPANTNPESSPKPTQGDAPETPPTSGEAQDSTS